MRTLFLLSFALPLAAQTNSAGGVVGAVLSPAPSHIASTGWASFSMAPGAPGGPVKGAPYSAEQVTEHVQTLADGTRITQPSQKVIYYRDSQGRTRIERFFPVPPGAVAKTDGGPNVIEISDPVSGADYTLDSHNHTAHKRSFQTAMLPRPLATIAPSSGKAVHFERRTFPAPASPDDQQPHPQVSRESLGTQTVEGVLAEGTRTTVVYPAGAVGNDRPIKTVFEQWVSPELKMTVLSKNQDPRNGESTTRLINISRVEPDPALFQVPSDYEIVDPLGTGSPR